MSVRNPQEAEVALAGGAALIDVKEPSRGSLGRGDDGTIAEVLAAVGGRRPVSAALGELREGQQPFLAAGLAFVKWGLSGCGENGTWRDRLVEVRASLGRRDSACKPVVVAYADWERAVAPAVPEVCQFACEGCWGGLLVDTWQKDGSTLLDWVTVKELASVRRSCEAAGVRLALAGSLGVLEMETLLPLKPDWFAVRGAACHGGRRTDAIDARAVRRLVSLLGKATVPASLGG